MDLQKAIGWGVLIIFGYFIVREFIQFIMIAVFCMALYQAYKNSQRPPRR